MRRKSPQSSFHIVWFWLILALVSVFAACKSTRPMRYVPPNELPSEQELSHIAIPVRLHRDSLQRVLDEQLGATLHTDSTYTDGSWMFRAVKRQPLQIEFLPEGVRYELALELGVRKDLLITDLGAVGEIQMRFFTRLEMDSSWNLHTRTTLEHYEWLRRPVLQVGGFNIPVQRLADWSLQRTRQALSRSIDDLVGRQFNLREEVEKAWLTMHEPQLLSEEYGSWLLFNPRRLAMTPLETTPEGLGATVLLTAQPHVGFGNPPPALSPPPLPPFRWEDSDANTLHLALRTAIPMQEAQRMAAQSLAGETFSLGKRKVRVDSIVLGTQADKVLVETLLSGDYEGWVRFTGLPHYHPESNRITLRDFDFELQTRRLLLQTAGWLFKGALKLKIQKELNFYLKENLGELKSELQKQLQGYRIAPGVRLSGALDEVEIAQAAFSEEGFRIELLLNGTLQVDIQ